MYIVSDELIKHWNTHNTCLSIKQKFFQSLGLDPGEYKFTANCAFMWEDEDSPCIAMNWCDYKNRTYKTIKIITLQAYINWFAGKKEKENPIKEDKNVNRLQKQKTQIDRGDFPEGNRVKGRACKTSIGVGHLSYCSIKTWSWNWTFNS